MPSRSPCERTYESAIVADSLMTSPSCPVSVSPLPAISVASTTSTSPPVPVTASPVATPATDSRLAMSTSGRGLPSSSRRSPATTVTGASTPSASFLADLRSTFWIRRSTLRTPASRVYSVTMRRSASSSITTSSDLEPVAALAARHEEARRDGDLLVLGVAVDADDLEAVEQSLGDLLGDVRRGDEEHLGEVDLEVEVVVAEGRVLRRVEDLEQRGRRIAAPVGAELVDLVEQDHRVHGAGVAQGPHEAARERADVGAPVTADLGLVADAAEAHAHELAVQRSARSTRPATSCRRREARPGRGWLRRPRPRSRACAGSCARPGTRGCGP